MYQQRVKDNWGRIIEGFTQANGGITLEDVPEKIEQFAYDMFKNEHPDLAEEEMKITIRDRLKYVF